MRSWKSNVLIATEEAAVRLIMVTVTTWLRPLADSTVLVTAAVYGVFLILGTTAGLFGIWLLVLTGASLWRYSYSVLRKVAQGRTQLPPPDIESMNPVGNWRLIAHFVLFVGLIALAGQLASGTNAGAGSLAGAALLLAVLCVFPGSAAIMGLSMNLAAALNPAAVIGVIKTLGRDYAALVAACVSLALVAQLTRAFLLPTLGLLSGLAGAVLAVWTELAVFALIGAAIHAHRDDFDIPGEQREPRDRDAEDRRREWRAELDLAYASIRSGELDKGYQALKKLIVKYGGSVEIQYWLFENMIDWEDRAHAFRVAERLVARLVEIGDLPAALELYRRCRGLGGKLAISPGMLRLLARYALEIGQAGLASELRAELNAPERYSV